MLKRLNNYLFKSPAVKKAATVAVIGDLKKGFDPLNAVVSLESNDYIYQAMLDNGIHFSKLKFLLDDDEIGGAWSKRSLAVEHRKFSLTDTESEAGLFIWDELIKWYKPLSAEFLRSVMFGLACPEIVYKHDDQGRLVIDYIIQHDISRFGVDTAGRVYVSINGARQAVHEHETLKHKLFPLVYKRTHDRPAGNPLLVSLVWCWFLRSNVWDYWARYLERFGSPQWLGKAAQGFDVETGLTNAEAMAEMLALAISSGVVVVGTEEDATAIDASSGGGESFNIADQRLSARVQKRILGQTLTTENTGTGSYAMARIHKDVSEEIAADDGMLITPAIQAVIDSLLILNYPDAKPVLFSIESDSGLGEARAKRDLDLYAQGVRFTDTYYSNHYDLEPDEFKVTEQAVPMPGQFSAPALSSLAFSEAAQDEVEALAGDAIRQAGNVVSAHDLKAIVLAAKNADDLADRLAKHYDKTAPEQTFSDVLAAMLFAADILGYEQADKGLGE